MGTIVVTEFMSLDGVVEDPGGIEGSRHGGWSFQLSRGDEGDRFKFDETMGADAMLLGRNTYEVFASSWPEREGEFADTFNAMPKYVYSSTLTNPTWTNTTVISGDLGDAVAQVKEAHDRDVVVHGSVRLTQELLDAGLVDELRIMLYPMILGTGKRLFGETRDMSVWRLEDSTVVGDGVMILVYRRARD